MKIIIQNNRAVAAVTDTYVATGAEQDVVPAPPGFDPGALSAYTYRGKDLATGKANLLAALEARRLVRQNSGLVYAFPDTGGTIQTRDPMAYPDLANVTGQATAALILAGQGVTGAVMAFRDQQNVTHMLTPAQMAAMAMAVSQFVAATYASKWTKSQEIAALATADAVQAYNLDAGWPP
jgi:hypothetical protein